MAAKKKMKKSLESIHSRLQLVMESGTYTLGYEQTLKMIAHGKTELVILAKNCPALRRSELECYAMLAKTVSVTTTVAIILNWAQLVGNTTENAHWPSLTQVILYH